MESKEHPAAEQRSPATCGETAGPSGGHIGPEGAAVRVIWSLRALIHQPAEGDDQSKGFGHKPLALSAPLSPACGFRPEPAEVGRKWWARSGTASLTSALCPPAELNEIDYDADDTITLGPDVGSKWSAAAKVAEGRAGEMLTAGRLK